MVGFHVRQGVEEVKTEHSGDDPFHECELAPKRSSGHTRSILRLVFVTSWSSSPASARASRLVPMSSGTSKQGRPMAVVRMSKVTIRKRFSVYIIVLNFYTRELERDFDRCYRRRPWSAVRYTPPWDVLLASVGRREHPSCDITSSSGCLSGYTGSNEFCLSTVTVEVAVRMVFK